MKTEISYNMNTENNYIFKNNLPVIKALGISFMLLQSAEGNNPDIRLNKDKPNIIFILTDDLGYGDLGVYGQKLIETPNIDRLAATGMYFTQHYCGSPVSAPSRCALLTGKHTGHAQIRGNDELEERGDVWNYKAMIADSTLEGQRPLMPGTITISRLFQQSGYKTGMIGKWGLGAPNTESIPTKMGFNNFYGINCQRMAHTYYPVFLYENDHRVYLNNDTVPPNKINSTTYLTYSLKEYSPDKMFTKLTDFVNDNKANPFFLYWATPIPHIMYQAPKIWVDYYEKKFADKKPSSGGKGIIYAAMISYLDDQVGKLVQQLKDLGIYENTLIIFSSDNGPADTAQWFQSGGPFKSEPGFAKGNVNEGGIRVPMIASWPRKIKPGAVSDHISAFWDILPTFCEIAGIKAPDETDGISFLPELTGKKQKKHEYLYWEYPESGGQQSVRIGNFKAMRKNMRKGNAEFELFDLKKDPGETMNIASRYPDIIYHVQEIIKKEHQKSQNEKWILKLIDDNK